MKRGDEWYAVDNSKKALVRLKNVTLDVNYGFAEEFTPSPADKENHIDWRGLLWFGGIIQNRDASGAWQKWEDAPFLASVMPNV